MLGIDPSNFAVVFGQVLRLQRKQLGLTQEQLAFEADLQRNYISLMELGRYQPTVATLFSLAHGLKVSPSDLVAALENALAEQHGNLKNTTLAE